MLSPDLKTLVETSVRSVDELHALVTCARERERWWDAVEMRNETGMPTAVAERALENLARRNLMDVRIAGTLRYRFSPASPALETAVVTLLDAYHKSPVAVTQLVAESMQRHVRDFSEAFRIRRDDSR
jgi:hypothetical protein